MFSLEPFFNRDGIDELFDEIEVLRKLDHPNIVKYIETFENSQFLYIVMELCEGSELFEMIHKKVSDEGTFNESETADIMKKLLKAINHCHSYKIAHRDIKPENIMVSSDGVSTYFLVLTNICQQSMSKHVHIAAQTDRFWTI